LRRLLAALPCWFPEPQTWITMEAWVKRAASAGERFALGDLLIGAVAAENGAAVWSLDGDFRRLEGLELVDLFAPSAHSDSPRSG
jgi:predicted nucleic acid-binding protein